MSSKKYYAVLIRTVKNDMIVYHDKFTSYEDADSDFSKICNYWALALDKIFFNGASYLDKVRKALGLNENLDSDIYKIWNKDFMSSYESIISKYKLVFNQKRPLIALNFPKYDIDTFVNDIECSIAHKQMIINIFLVSYEVSDISADTEKYGFILTKKEVLKYFTPDE